MQNVSLMEIKRADVEAEIGAATQAMRSSRGLSAAPASQATGMTGLAPSAVPVRPRFNTLVPGMGAMATPVSSTGQESNLIDAIKAIHPDDPLPSEAETHVLRAIRTGIAVSRAVVKLFETTTELGRLKSAANTAGRMGESDTALLSELHAAAGLVSAFVCTSYVVWSLGDYLVDPKVADASPEPADYRLENSTSAVNSFVAELCSVVSGAHDDAELTRLVRHHCRLKATALGMRAMAARHLDRYLASRYRLEGSEYTIEGFALSAQARSTTLSMAFKKPEEVVGNHIAKSQSMRLAKMLMAYDFEHKTSPFVILGGHVHTFMGDGFPGTGKTTLIQMICGLLHDYCNVAGYPFRYQNFGVDEISEFQGVSGRNCKSFVDTVQDPAYIGFGTIDDIDQIAGKRGDKQSSGGQQEVTAALMDAFAGANTVVRGNCSFGMFSNYPENVDEALRQRAGARFLIDGPQTLEDYRDLLAILLKRNLDTIGMGEAQGQLFLTQSIKEAVRASYDKLNRPSERKIVDVFDQVTNRLGKLDDLNKLSIYLKAIRDAEPRFTGRAVKNIADAVKTRAMDFDMPDEWFASPEPFMHQPMERKVDMIKELMLPVTPDMVLQQINTYADSEARYGDKSFEAAVDSVVRDHKVRQAAAQTLGLNS